MSVNGGSDGNGDGAKPSRSRIQPYKALWEYDEPSLDKWIKTVSAVHGEDSLVGLVVANQLWNNLSTALQSLTRVERAKPPPPEDEEDEDEEERVEPQAKRSKTEKGSVKLQRKPKILYDIVDPFNLYLHTIRKNDDDEEDELAGLVDPYQEAASELETSIGGKLAQLSLSGVMNGMAGVHDGVTINKQCHAKEGMNKDTLIETAENISFGKLKVVATALHQAIQACVEADVLVTTPLRIQEMLAGDLQPNEFKAIRKRVYDTVILGKGLAQANPDDADLPTATSASNGKKSKKCKTCGNNDQSNFKMDMGNGDIICLNCGTVVSESLMHEGSAYRKFEGEADRNHHGDAPNRLYSNAHNMSTSLSGMQMTTGAGVAGFGTHKKGLETILRNAHAYTELNISQFGKGDRRTRTGYKDKQKRDAFYQMTHCGDALNLHQAVVQRAKEIFAGFRDDRELVQQFKGVIAACLCVAFEQLSSDGKQILKQKQEAPQETFVNPRANRRNELHHANLAGKGGLLLDFSAVKKEEEIVLSSVSQKPTATWDLYDCRTWLMEAARSIAEQWIHDRKNGVQDIPDGTLEELEGKLVDHAITLNDALEAEWKQQHNTNVAGAAARGRVVTPRVTDMTKLGIKWQHAHERGSGGKGGVGGSGIHVQTSGRTAGQILLLKTAQKLGVIMKDAFAGQAIHKELRSLVSKQEAQKRKLHLEETTRQRFSQMKRKPWLQARTQS